MITFEKFKELFNAIESNRHPEIGIYFKDGISSYMIVKFEDYLTIGKLDCTKGEIYKFNSIDELYNASIENICLKEDWNKIEDILIDLTFSVVDDKEYFSACYNVYL